MAKGDAPAARKPNETDVPSALAAQKTGETLRLITLAVEVHNGNIGNQLNHIPMSVVQAEITLGESAPTTHILIMDGALYVSALDAAAFGVRERKRLLAVARRCASNG